jgi:hypothetical protein
MSSVDFCDLRAIRGEDRFSETGVDAFPINRPDQLTVVRKKKSRLKMRRDRKLSEMRLIHRD